jgi:hypothetical protein
MFTCRNQACQARWDAADLSFANEGQGFIFRCPQCGARNPVSQHTLPGGAVEFRQGAAGPDKPAR